jgi:hypothetical protein
LSRNVGSAVSLISGPVCSVDSTLQSKCSFARVFLQDLALKLRAEGRGYDPKVFKKKKDSKAGSGGGGGGAAAAGGKHKKAKVKIKSSQRDKAPYHVRASATAAGNCWCCW